MTPSQTAFLNSVAKRIPALMEAIRLGNQRSEFILGRRHINGRQVRLILVAEVVDAGANPLATHSSHSAELLTTSDRASARTSEPTPSPTTVKQEQE